MLVINSNEQFKSRQILIDQLLRLFYAEKFSEQIVKERIEYRMPFWYWQCIRNYKSVHSMSWNLCTIRPTNIHRTNTFSNWPIWIVCWKRFALCTIPKGALVLVILFNLHRLEDIWGSDAHEFNPEHFSTEWSTGRVPYAFLPFGGVPRDCK